MNHSFFFLSFSLFCWLQLFLWSLDSITQRYLRLSTWLNYWCHVPLSLPNSNLLSLSSTLSLSLFPSLSSSLSYCCLLYYLSIIISVCPICLSISLYTLSLCSTPLYLCLSAPLSFSFAPSYHNRIEPLLCLSQQAVMSQESLILIA